MKTPDTGEHSGGQDFDLLPSSAQKLAALMKNNYARSGKNIQEAGMQPE
ncbi:MAG TPA: hypothetical protein VK663_04720 [Burkholderiales bacterium]|nr:hypothetical protein [Burkholderiales bacterium]